MPMRFQSLDLNMGDNYVDKHRMLNLIETQLKESTDKEYIIVREATISLFENLSETDLLKLGTASNASVSVRGIGYCILGHELHHKNIIIERYL